MTIQEQIIEKIKEFDTIIIHRHQRPDPDAYGSQLGLKAILQATFPDKTIKATGQNEPTLSWIGSMDVVLDAEYDNALVIVTDTANTERIDDSRYDRGAALVKIDHHPNDDVYGGLVWVNTTASSCSEMIASIAFDYDLTMTVTAAQFLYAGIVGDTGRFLYPATSSQTFAVASKLRSFDFDFAWLSRQMDTVSYKIAKLTGYVYDHMEVDETGAARLVLSQDIMKAYDVTEAETSAVVGAPGRIEQVQAWAIFVEQPAGGYRVRMRSKYIPINEIAKRHDGGGHPLASGANSSSPAENDHIFQEMKEVLNDASKQ